MDNIRKSIDIGGGGFNNLDQLDAATQKLINDECK